MTKGDYYIDEEELGELLHQLFIVEGRPEVEVVHPTDGPQVITREEYDEMQRHLKRAADMSPAERLLESKRLERQKHIRFRTALADAESFVVDIDDEENFGKDIDGKEIPIDGKLFTRADSYPDGTAVLENELGCFFDESMKEPPIRIRSKDPISLSPTQAVETDDRNRENPEV